ncbi:MAG TPA: hypothetical protein VGJ73_02485 [Verrucomicrobiae bacterium]|jgi:hypothetical protein
MAKQKNDRDLDTLIAKTEKNRAQVQKASEKLKRLEAAIEHAKITPTKQEASRSRNEKEPNGPI